MQGGGGSVCVCPHQGQWWSILRTQWPQRLQWWDLLGRIKLHLLHSSQCSRSVAETAATSRSTFSLLGAVGQT